MVGLNKVGFMYISKYSLTPSCVPMVNKALLITFFFLLGLVLVLTAQILI